MREGLLLRELADGYVKEFEMKELLSPEELDAVMYNRNLPGRPLFDALEPFLEAQHLKTLNGILKEIDVMLKEWFVDPHGSGEITFSAYLRQQLQKKPVKKTSEEWQKLCKVKVIDADGWDRQNYKYSWYQEQITCKEFERRMYMSTCEFLPEDLNNIWYESPKNKE